MIDLEQLKQQIEDGELDQFNMHFAKTNFSKLVNSKSPIVIATRGKAKMIMIPIEDFLSDDNV